MEVTHSQIDVAQSLAQDVPPIAVIQRAASEAWLVSYDAIRMDQPIAWTQTSKEALVSIPLVPYLVRPGDEHLPLTMAYMLQLGMRVSFDLGRPIKRLHLAIGCPIMVVDEGGQTFWQYWVGFGVVLE